jgi:tetratricopeptide (TPR) repeat protein
LLLEISASLLQREGKRDQAEDDYIAALRAISETGKQDSADAAAVQRNIAYLYVEEHRYREASKAVDAALATLRRAKDAVPLDRIQMLDVRATALAYQGRWREAEADLRDAISLARAQPHLDSIELEPVVRNYAQVLRKLRRKEARSVEASAATLRSETAPSRQTVDVTELSAVSK